MKSKYYERKEKGLCPRCGKSKTGGRTCKKCCEENAESRRKRYAKRKSEGLCPHCGKIKTGGTVCKECLNKFREYSFKRVMNLSEKEYEALKDEYKYSYLKVKTNRQSEGLCPRCGQRKPFKGYKHCSLCRTKWRNKRKVRYAKLKEEGLCPQCGKRKTISDKDFIYCSSCRAKSLIANKKIRSAKKINKNNTI